MNRGKSIARRIALVGACLVAASLAAAGPALADDHGGQGSSRSSGKPTQTVTVTSTSTPAPQSGTLSVRGVVQLVSATSVTVKQLDGSVVNVPVDRRTKVYVDGKTARLVDVKRGSVLVTSWKAGQPADTLRFVRP